jgi:diadenosine tetraphosphate (Ap4A) HIT family hydrolase
MSVNATFTNRVAGIDCPMCLDSHAEDIVIELGSGKVHLQNDANYRGYCILIFHRHAVELHELTAEERHRWIEDVAAIGRAIVEVCGPAKLNVAMLGNQSPHLHCHVIPRYPTDTEWGHPPAFLPPAERASMTTEDFEQLRATLAHHLTATIAQGIGNL